MVGEYVAPPTLEQGTAVLALTKWRQHIVHGVDKIRCHRSPPPAAARVSLSLRPWPGDREPTLWFNWGTKRGAASRIATRDPSCESLICCRGPTRPGTPSPCLSTACVLKSVISRSTFFKGADEGGGGRSPRSVFIFSRGLFSSRSISGRLRGC